LLIEETLAAQPTASIPGASEDWAEAKAIYRFWDNSKVSAIGILEGYQSQVQERIAQQKVVLSIQDTTDLSFVHHPSKTGAKGFGLLSGQDYLLGLKVHSTLAVSEHGVPLGILDQEVWARPPEEKGKAKQRRQRSLKEKESVRWLRSQVASELGMAEGVTMIAVADAEADIYELMALERSESVHLLIRANHNRWVEHPSQYLKAAIALRSGSWNHHR
jgi:Transposase DNA-binding